MRCRIGSLISLLALATACVAGEDTELSPSDPPSEVAAPTASPTEIPEALVPTATGTVSARSPAGPSSGNRFVEGRADLVSEPLEIALGSRPAWVVGAALGERVVWVVVDENGVASAIVETGGALVESSLEEQAKLPPGAPPTVMGGDGGVSLLLTRDGAQQAGHTVVRDKKVEVGANGEVRVDGMPVDGFTALLDGRIVVSGRGEVAFLAQPTDRLAHGVLGDRIESQSLVVLAPGSTSIQAVIDAPDETVFEMLAPIWADVDDDGKEEILLTASDEGDGARLAVFSAGGEPIAQSPPIGTGNRWLNQLAVAPVGPGREIEVIEVSTPHIGGIVNWYRLKGEKLELQTSAGSYSTHRIGSRNVDQGIVVDANGDRRPDVVVPNQNQDAIVALTRTLKGSEISLEQPLGARLSTNLSAVTRGDGTATLALGTEDARLLIWP